jgi:lactoylglutathione lyase
MTPENDYAELLGGETTLAFASVALAKSNLKSSGFTECRLTEKPFAIEIGFTTDQVAETVSKALEAGATLVEELKTKPWG